MVRCDISQPCQGPDSTGSSWPPNRRRRTERAKLSSQSSRSEPEPQSLGYMYDHSSPGATWNTAELLVITLIMLRPDRMTNIRFISSRVSRPDAGDLEPCPDSPIGIGIVSRYEMTLRVIQMVRNTSQGDALGRVVPISDVRTTPLTATSPAIVAPPRQQRQQEPAIASFERPSHNREARLRIALGRL
jgi:hypothetical protein